MSINGINNNGMDPTRQLRGFGGLASGLDRDSLIDQMTYGTKSKIASQEQKKQSLEWTQKAIQNVSDKMYDFSSKYTSYASKDNLISANSFAMNQITAVGENSAALSVTGRVQEGINVEVAGVKQMATKAQVLTEAVSDKAITTGKIDLDGMDVNQLDGERLKFKMGKKTLTVKLDFTTEQKAKLEAAKSDSKKTAELTAEYINKAMEDVRITQNSKLSDNVKFEAGADGKLSLKGVGKAGNSVVFKGGSEQVVKALGFDGMDEDELTITDGSSVEAKEETKVFKKEKTMEKLSGKKLQLSWNGKKHDIELDKYGDGTTLEDIKNDIQSKVDSAFGSNRMKVETEDGRLSFKAIKTDGSADSSSIIKISGGSDDLVGRNGVFGIQAGTSNRVNLNAKIGEAGISGFNLQMTGAIDDEGKPILDEEGVQTEEFELKINGKSIHGINENMSIREMMDKINSSDAGVTISYLENSDKFSVVSNNGGAGGKVEAEGALAEALGINGTATEGRDAVMMVKYGGSDEIVEVISDNNTFEIDGLSITAKKTFQSSPGEAVTFEANIDADKVSENVENMIKEYNEILETAGKYVNTKPNHKYKPLTDEQRDEMTDKQIEKWENKAKEGLLFGDRDMRAIVDNMRFMISPRNSEEYKEIGITVSDKYTDNGKLVFDADKFKEALKKDPSKVRNLMAGKGSVGKIKDDGLVSKMGAVMDRYSKSTGAVKGILVERAGSKHSPTSVLNNTMLNQIKSIDEKIKGLNHTLSSEQDRYIKQFTSLETLISQMNSQSEYFAQMFSNGM